MRHNRRLVFLTGLLAVLSCGAFFVVLRSLDRRGRGPLGVTTRHTGPASRLPKPPKPNQTPEVRPKTAAARIPSGYRLAFVTLHGQGAFGRLLAPGDRVDVMGTFGVNDPAAHSRGHVAILLLQHLEIAAISHDAAAPDDVTLGLYVVPGEQQTLDLAAQSARLDLLVRNATDIEYSPGRRRTLKSALEELARLAAPRRGRQDDQTHQPTIDAPVLAKRVPRGMRAVFVPARLPLHAIHRSDTVDVTATFSPAELVAELGGAIDNADGKLSAELGDGKSPAEVDLLLLRRVLAVVPARPPKPGQAPTTTAGLMLSVRPEQALMLPLAAQVGKLHVQLRRADAKLDADSPRQTTLRRVLEDLDVMRLHRQRRERPLRHRHRHQTCSTRDINCGF